MSTFAAPIAPHNPSNLGASSTNLSEHGSSTALPRSKSNTSLKKKVKGLGHSAKKKMKGTFKKQKSQDPGSATESPPDDDDYISPVDSFGPSASQTSIKAVDIGQLHSQSQASLAPSTELTRKSSTKTSSTRNTLKKSGSLSKLTIQRKILKNCQLCGLEYEEKKEKSEHLLECALDMLSAAEGKIANVIINNEKKVDAMNEEKQELCGQITELEAEKKGLTLTVARTMELVEAEKLENEKITKEMEEATQALDSVTGRLNSTIALLDHAYLDLHRIKKDNERIQKDMTKVQSSNEQLQTEMENAKKALEQKKSDLTAIKKELETSRGEIVQQKAIVEKTNKNLHEARAKIWRMRPWWKKRMIKNKEKKALKVKSQRSVPIASEPVAPGLSGPTITVSGA
eukprot:CFRG0186T1